MTEATEMRRLIAEVAAKIGGWFTALSEYNAGKLDEIIFQVLDEMILLTYMLEMEASDEGR